MVFGINHTDLFNAPEHYHLVHCVSADFALGAGIAKEFVSRFNTRQQLRAQYPNFNFTTGTCLPTGRVLNLVTKQHYYNKPTYETLTQSLEALKQYVIDNNLKFIAMPAIGCGLDKLNWTRVSCIIQQLFKDVDVKIVVCVK